MFSGRVYEIIIFEEDKKIILNPGLVWEETKNIWKRAWWSGANVFVIDVWLWQQVNIVKNLPLEQIMEGMWLDAVQMSSVLTYSSWQKLIGVERFAAVYHEEDEHSGGQNGANLFSPHWCSSVRWSLKCFLGCRGHCRSIGLSLQALKESRGAHYQYLTRQQLCGLHSKQTWQLFNFKNYFSENCGGKICCIYESDLLGLPWSLNKFEYNLNELQCLDMFH